MAGLDRNIGSRELLLGARSFVFDSSAVQERLCHVSLYGEVNVLWDIASIVLYPHRVEFPTHNADNMPTCVEEGPPLFPGCTGALI